MLKKILSIVGLIVAFNMVYAAGGAETPAPAATPPATTAPAPAHSAPAAASTPAATAPAPATAPSPPAAASTPAATAPAPAAPATSDAAPAVEINLSGKWSSVPNGSVMIEQTGNKIAGTYHYQDDDDVTQEGKLEGVIEGMTIKARWWERPKVGKGEESRGDVEWKIVDDGKMLAGWYREEGSKDKEDWNLSR